jgi:hypothetical protein
MLCVSRFSKQELSSACGSRVTYLLHGQEINNHCAAGAARTAKPARRAKGRMPEVTEKATPLGACRPSGNRSLRCLNSGILALAMGGKSVSRGRAFRQHIPVLTKRNRLRATAPALPQLRHPCRRHADSRYAACRPRLTAAQRPRVERRAIVARTFHGSQSQSQSQSQSRSKIWSAHSGGCHLKYLCLVWIGAGQLTFWLHGFVVVVTRSGFQSL